MISCTTRSKRFSIVILSAILLLSLLMSSACVCDPGVYLKIDNQTDQPLGIFISKLHEVDVAPGELVEGATMLIPPKPDLPPPPPYLIEAKTKDGKVVYSKEFTWQELDDMGWTIVIPPSP